MTIEFATSTSGRTIMARFHPGTDLLNGVAQVCDELGVTAAAIVSIQGTLERAVYTSVAVTNEGPMGIGYAPTRVLEGPVEFLLGQGHVARFDNGECFVHLHAMFADLDIKVFGGHLLPNENPVLQTIDLTMIEAADINLIRKHDEVTGLQVMEPRQGESRS